jgi:hypothetical protein
MNHSSSLIAQAVPDFSQQANATTNYECHQIQSNGDPTNMCTANSNGRKCLAWACKVKLRDV